MLHVYAHVITTHHNYSGAAQREKFFCSGVGQKSFGDGCSGVEILCSGVDIGG